MVRKTGEKTVSRKMTIDQLMEVCRAITPLGLKDAVAYGRDNGLTRHNIESLRQILGLSDNTNSYKLTPEERDAIAAEYKNEEVSMSELARRHKVTYNAVRCILLARNVVIVNRGQYTKRQVLYIKNELRRGTSVKKIAEIMGKSVKSIKQKIDRMKRSVA